MAEELQNLLEKIKRDGVDKANAEAAAIVNKAKAEAAAIVKDAQAQAEAAKAAAKTQADQYAARAADTIRQAARDTVQNIESAVTTLLSALLTKSVDTALADPAVAAPLAAEAVKALVKGDAAAEVAANGKLVEAFQAGFTVKLDGGRVEHDFTGAVVTDALASRLRPDLAKLLK